jgi:hypothetical protein
MANSANADEALIIEGQLYAWLLQNGYTSEQHANPLASLLKRSGIDVVPNNMKRGKLLNFFEDRPNIFGIVRGTDEAKNISIYAILREREGNSGRGHPRGRGGPGRYYYERSKQGQELLDAQEAQEQELLDAQMLNDAIRPNLPLDYPPELELNDTNPLMLRNAVYDERKLASEKNQQSPFDYKSWVSYGGKKSKSRRSARKSRSKKNRNRRNKTARKYRKSKSHRN